MSEFANIDLSTAGAVATLRLNRPDKLNPLDWATVRELATAVAALEGRDDVRAVIVTGNGRAFSAGGDLEGYLTLYRKPDDFRQFLEDFFALLGAIEASRLIYIAAVNGVTVAGGLELMLACDLVLIAREAKIGDGHLNFAQLPGAGGSQRLPRAIGALRAKELILTGELIDGEAAVGIGLANRAVDGAVLLDEALALAERLNGHSAAALKGAKTLVNHGLTMALDDALRYEMDYVHAYATGHPDAMEGLQAFAEKRPPRYRND